jgi:hypothetical protein
MTSYLNISSNCAVKALKFIIFFLLELQAKGLYFGAQVRAKFGGAGKTNSLSDK